MRFFSVVASLATSVYVVSAQNTTAPAPGYGNITSTIPASNSTFSFGQRYAVLNLDLINAIVGNFNGTDSGRQFINSTKTWIDAVHAVEPQPLTVFTRIYYSTRFSPELGLGVPFGSLQGGLANITEESPQGMLYPAFETSERDVVLPKTRFYAGEWVPVRDSRQARVTLLKRFYLVTKLTLSSW